MNRFVYLDNNATTKIADAVLQKMQPYLTLQFGNPNSITAFGKNVRTEINTARKNVASFIGATPETIVFTGSGSEANAAAINSAIKTYKNKKHIITTVAEHASVIEHCNLLKKEGYTITFLSVNEQGLINLTELENAITKHTAVVSILYANNETGVLQDYSKISQIIEKKKQEFSFDFHMDCVQALGKISINAKKLNADFLSFSGHKINAPKGCGFLYVKEPETFVPLIPGHQENSLRGGTENVLGLVAMGEAALLHSAHLKEHVADLKSKQLFLEKELKALGGIINGAKEKRLPNTISVSFKTITGNELMYKLEAYGITVSTGSACNAINSRPSHVLTAMNLPLAANTIRVSFSAETTEAHLKYFLDKLRFILNKQNS